MTKANASNERIKRHYFRYLREALGRDEVTIDGVAKSIARFEEATGAKDFRRFHREQAVAFKSKLTSTANARTGEPLSRATMLSTLRDLRSFFMWLAREPGYRTRIHYADADYFNLPDEEVAIARARREKQIPTIGQVEEVLRAMPTGAAIERRDRAVMALAAITAARVGALASLRLGHADVDLAYVDQDARTVRTKGSKTFRTYFMPVVDGATAIFKDWVEELKRDHHRGPTDPLFPATEMGLGPNGGFMPMGLSLRGWSSTEPVRAIFRRGFAAANLPYFNPHSFRDLLTHHAMSLSLTPEEMKAWSQNLGDAHVTTTLTSYGQVPTHRQGGSDPSNCQNSRRRIRKRGRGRLGDAQGGG